MNFYEITLSPYFVVSMNVIYLSIVRYFYLSYKPYKLSLKSFIPIHNFINIAISLVTLYYSYYEITSNNLSPLSYNNNCEGRLHELQKSSYIYYISKFYEYTDTIIMLLKHNYHQVTILHVYHHSSVSIGSWYVAKYQSCGDVFLSGVLNSMVHVIMYLSYTFNKKNKLLKQLTTSIQIAQFIVLLFQGILLYNTNRFFIFQIYYVCSMLFLFLSFYFKTYLK